MLTASDRTDAEIRELEIQMGGGSVADTHSTEWGEEDNFWEAAAVKEDGDVLVEITPITSSKYVGPTNSAVWVVQGPIESDNIWVVYASFDATDSDSIGELLWEIALCEDGGEVTLGVGIETRGGRPAPHIVPLHGLGVDPYYKYEDSEVSVYT